MPKPVTAVPHRAPRQPKAGEVPERRFVLTANSVLRYDLGDHTADRAFVGKGCPTVCAPGQPRQPLFWEEGRPPSSWFTQNNPTAVGKTTRPWRVTVEADGAVLVANVNSNRVVRWAPGPTGTYQKQQGSLLKVVKSRSAAAIGERLAGSGHGSRARSLSGTSDPQGSRPRILSGASDRLTGSRPGSRVTVRPPAEEALASRLASQL